MTMVDAERKAMLGAHTRDGSKIENVLRASLAQGLLHEEYSPHFDLVDQDALENHMKELVEVVELF